ncbi:unnamed protein product [Ambrosiozyma monospora]|uniref:Unnamed protein product n=1 Tax=Ambrosiozyma monospora TaxID=43982 RepID=A0ACB5SSE0_AMBMO|nr:unnamed protein product [Ambrosiozyma monospora]
MYRGNNRGGGRNYSDSNYGRKNPYWNPNHGQREDNYYNNDPYHQNNTYQQQQPMRSTRYSNHYNSHHYDDRLNSQRSPTQNHQYSSPSPATHITSPYRQTDTSVSTSLSNTTTSNSSTPVHNFQEVTNIVPSSSSSLNHNEPKKIPTVDLKKERLKVWKMKKDSGTVNKPSMMKFKSNASRSKKLHHKKVLSLKSNLFSEDDEDSTQSKSAKTDTSVDGDKKDDTNKEIENNDADIDSVVSLLAKSTRNSVQTVPSESVLAEDEDDLIMEEEQEVNDSDDETKDPVKLLQTINERNKKLIPEHDPNTTPFVKSFYQESEFIKNLKDSEVSSLRLRDGIVIRGRHKTRPVLTWSQLGLPSSLLGIVEDMSFDTPTPIQCETLPSIMSGLDLIGIAKTGSGKTLAFLLPLFRQILSNELSRSSTHHNNKNQSCEPVALIMTPTRELAVQIFKECDPFFKKFGLRGACCYGGQPINQQIGELKKGCDLIVGTPGRLIDLLCVNGGRCLNFSNIRYAVLDEADRMFDLGFEPQVMKIMKSLRPDRQTVMFSATFPPKMEALAKKILHNPVEIMIGARNLVNDSIKQKFEILNDDEKFNKLLQVLGEFKSKDTKGKVIIFADTQDGCDKLATQLVSRGYPSISLHGGKDQVDRDATISYLKDGIIDIIVATSVASRGLDIKDLNLVVNYDSPNHMEDYVHRVGRTGRAGKEGESYTFVTPAQDKAAHDIVKLLELSNQPVPDKLAELANKFRQKLQKGDVKYSSGFSGKGLEKLQAIREEHRKLEKELFDGDSGSGSTDDDAQKQDDSTTDNDTSDKATAAAVANSGISMDDFKVIYGMANSGPESSSYHAKLNINDLPQMTRWHVTNRESMGKVIEMTSCSVTTKGRFYPAGKSPAEGEDPKLYLLIEGETDSKVREAVEMFKELLIEGLKQVKDSANAKGGNGGGKYTIY